MKAEPTLNEMCEYIESNMPKGYCYSISQYKRLNGLHLLFHFPDGTCDLKTAFRSMKDAVEYLFNYYFAVNNK